MGIHIIPQPSYVLSEEMDSGIRLKETDVVLRMPEEDERLIRHGNALFRQLTVEKSAGEMFSLTCNVDVMDRGLAERSFGKNDGYSLRTGKGSLELYADTAAGLFYGMCTLKQLGETAPKGLLQATIVDWAEVKLRSDYLDMRTIYPTFAHILEYIKKLAGFKLNTLVIEYEDKLPFQKMKFLRHPEYALTMEQFEMIKDTAREYFIDIIPLQQSFGHLEYVLKQEKYKYLREVPQVVGEMCPLREGAAELAAELLEEMALLHPDSQWLHLGCDEVWSLGSSPECRESGLSIERIFIMFVNHLTETACRLGKQPIIWHDMIARCQDEDLALLDKRVTVAVWIYNGNDLKYQAVTMIRKLRKHGIRVLGAGAVRSADRDGDQNYPVAVNRIANLNGWSEIACEEQLEGLIDTNWASPFSLGKPYGLYESAFYTIAYGAERCWNHKGGREDFLDRFYHIFHGVSDCSLTSEGFRPEDYYQLIPRMMRDIRKNRQAALFIEVMLRYEHGMKLQFPAHSQMFRAEIFPDKEEEITSLRTEAEYTYGQLKTVKKDMEQIVSELLTAPMAELFIRSRYFLPELYEKTVSLLLKGEKVL